MNSFRGSIQLLRSQCLGSSRIFHLQSMTKIPMIDDARFNPLVPTYSGSDGFTTVEVFENPSGSFKGFPFSRMTGRSLLQVGMDIQMEKTSCKLYESSTSTPLRSRDPRSVERAEARPPYQCRSIATTVGFVESTSQDPPPCVLDVPPRIKFKRLDKTAKHIMQIIDKEAVEEVRSQRDIPDIKPGYIVQLKVEVPENKRRVSILKGIVIARRNAGLNSTFRIRRLVAGVGVESMFPLYSPNIKEIKVLEKKKVRRAKLYYLRDKMNALKKH